ncbi:MAG: hypothetical protein GC178_14915 [Flavobacteriales bacterium]|nr:hypothetical protein [Flavobacteriales bacterium]
MRLIILSSVLLCASYQLFAQEHVVKVYKTYEAYQKRDGKEIGEFWNFFWSLREFVLVTKNGGREVKTNTDGFWGFTVDSALYRVDHNTPYRVDIVAPELVFYQHGIGKSLNYIGERADRPNTQDNYQFSRYHISVDMNSEIFVITSGKAKKAFAGNEKGLAVLKCAKWKTGMENDGTRKCVTDNL